MGYDTNAVVDTLHKKGFHARYCADAAAARDAVMEITKDCGSYGAGGSVTLQQTGILDALVATGKPVYSSALEADGQKDAARQRAMGADCFLASTNALTMEGDLVNIDGIGNRVAAMFYGPGKVVVVCGINKLTDNPHTAIARIKREACPKNAARLGLDTPCAKTGQCADCDSPDRMCRVTVRIQYPPHGREIYVVLVGEELGF